MSKNSGNSEQIQRQIAELEEGIQSSKQKLAELRREMPREEVKNFAFKDSFGREVRLSDLFGDKSELVLVHNMGIGCSYCTAWADGFNGVLKHLESRMAFVIESADDPVTQRSFAADRGWALKMVSSKGTNFKKEMGYASEKNSPIPGLSVFTQSSPDGKIYRVSDTALGPGDNFCVIWDLFDLLPKAWEGDELDYYYSKLK